MAILANVFFLFMLGSIEAGRYFFVSESLRYLVGEIARAVIVNPDATWGTAEKSSFVASRAAILRYANFATLDVNVVKAAAPALTNVTVAARYNHSFVLPGISGLPQYIDTGVTMRFVAP